MRSGMQMPGRAGEPLVALLQSPAHRVLRVLQVTRSNWHAGDGPRRGLRIQPASAPLARGGALG